MARPGGKNETRTQLSNFGIAWTSQTTAATLIFAVPALAPLLIEKLALTTSEIGVLVAITYVGISSVSVFFGIVSDSLGIRKVLFLGHALEAVSIIGASLAHNFVGLAVAVLGVGIGYSSITPVTSKAIMDWFSRERRSSVMGLKQTGTTVGGSIAGAVLPSVAVKYGLGASFIAAAIIVMFGAVFLVGYRESRDDFGKKPNEKTGFAFLKHGLSISLKNKDLLWLGGVGFFFACIQSVVVTYIALFARNVLGYDAVIAGLFLSLVNAAGTIGRPSFGFLSEKLLGGSRIKDLLIIASTSFVMLILLSFIKGGIAYYLIVPIVAVLGFGALGWNGVFLTLAGEYSDKSYGGVGTSLAFSIAMSGQVVAAPIFGLIIQSTNDYDLAWRIFGIALISASIVFTIARRNRDITNETAAD